MLPATATNVLVCLRYGIGDVVMELPALAALRSALPRARITALANPPAEELLEGDGRVDRIVSTSRWGLRHRWDRGDEETRRRIAAWTAGEGFDLHLDVRHAPPVVGEAIWGRGIESLEASGEAEREALESGLGGVQAISAAAAAGWGLYIDPSLEPRLRLRPADRARARRLLDRVGGDGDAPVAVSPVASHDLKRWPDARFARIADRAVERHGRRVLILEGPQTERGRAVRRAMRHGDAAVRVGAWPLLHTAALLERCAALVCNDTGLMHLATAVGAPTVAVFGPTRPETFLDRSAAARGVAPRALDCPHREVRSLSPPRCWNRGRCLIGPRSCVHRVGVEEVGAALDRLLHPSGRDRDRRHRWLTTEYST